MEKNYRNEVYAHAYNTELAKRKTMTTEEIIQIAGKNCSGKTFANEYVFTKEELLWFVNDLSTAERKSISEGEVKQKAVAFARHMNIVDITYPSHSKTMSIEQIYDYWITNIYK